MTDRYPYKSGDPVRDGIEEERRRYNNQPKPVQLGILGSPEDVAQITTALRVAGILPNPRTPKGP